jgi:hypothetical protein
MLHAIVCFTASLVFVGLCTAAHATCGTRGGPGYRAPDGHCVGWAEIGKVCGSPPSTRCTAENVATGSDSAADHGAKIQKLRSGSSAPTGGH